MSDQLVALDQQVFEEPVLGRVQVVAQIIDPETDTHAFELDDFVRTVPLQDSIEAIVIADE